MRSGVRGRPLSVRVSVRGGTGAGRGGVVSQHLSQERRGGGSQENHPPAAETLQEEGGRGWKRGGRSRRGGSGSVFPGEKSSAGAGTDPGGRLKAWRPAAGVWGARCASPSSRPPREAGCTPSPAGQAPLTGAHRRGWAPGEGALRRLPRQMPGAPWKAEICDAAATASFPPRCREAGHDPGALSSFGAGMRS